MPYLKNEKHVLVWYWLLRYIFVVKNYKHVTLGSNMGVDDINIGPSVGCSVKTQP